MLEHRIRVSQLYELLREKADESLRDGLDTVGSESTVQCASCFFFSNLVLGFSLIVEKSQTVVASFRTCML